MKKKVVFLFFIFMLIGLGLVYSQTITVTNPAAGIVWCKGQSYNITWTKTGTMPNFVKIWLRNPASTQTILEISAKTDNDGSFSWPVPGTIANGNYRIRVVTGGGTIWGDSPVFTIKKCKLVFRFYYITVTEPHAGAYWDGGETHNIEWETNYKSQLKIQLYDYNGKNLIRDITSLRTFPTTAPDKYYFPWPIPTDISPGNYTIRVSNQTDTVKGLSKKFFIRQKLVTKTYYVPVTTVNKCRWHEHDSRTDYPIIGKEFVSSIGEYPDPGAGKMRVGFQNHYHSSDYHKHYIYRSFLGVNVDPYKVGKGFFLKATLQYVPTPHISQPAAMGGLRLFYLDEVWNGTWEHLFNIKANILSSSTDVTQIVRDWLLGTSPNYGFLMVGPNEMMQNNSDYCIYTTTKVTLKLEFLQQAQ